MEDNYQSFKRFTQWALNAMKTDDELVKAQKYLRDLGGVPAFDLKGEEETTRWEAALMLTKTDQIKRVGFLKAVERRPFHNGSYIEDHNYVQDAAEQVFKEMLEKFNEIAKMPAEAKRKEPKAQDTEEEVEASEEKPATPKRSTKSQKTSTSKTKKQQKEKEKVEDSEEDDLEWETEAPKKKNVKKREKESAMTLPAPKAKAQPKNRVQAPVVETQPPVAAAKKRAAKRE